MSDVGLFWVGLALIIGALAWFARWLESTSRISKETEDGIQAGLEGGVSAHRARWWHDMFSGDGDGGGGDGGGGGD